MFAFRSSFPFSTITAQLARTAKMSTISASDFYFEGGDVMILGTIDEVVHGLVYSQVLCLTSCVLKRLIYP